jgi:hypothetical protein
VGKVLIVSGALLALGCGGARQPVEPPGAVDPEVAIDEAIAMFVEVGELVMAAKDDCPTMAAAVGSWLDANGVRRARINASLARIDSAVNQQTYGARLGEHLDVVFGLQAGIEGCLPDGREDQPMVGAVQILGGHDVRDLIPGALIEHQAAEQRLLGFDGMWRQPQTLRGPAGELGGCCGFGHPVL